MDAGTYDHTNFVLLGDHYQINVQRMIHLNMLFVKQGWLTPLAGKTTYRNDWRVTAKTCDGETYIYTRGYVNTGRLKQLIAGVEGVEHIYDGAEAVKLGADPRCTFLVEAKPGYYFTDEVNRPAVVEDVDPDSLGTHDRYQGFMAMGQASQATSPRRYLPVRTSTKGRPSPVPTWSMRDQPLPNYWAYTIQPRRPGSRFPALLESEAGSCESISNNGNGYSTTGPTPATES